MKVQWTKRAKARLREIESYITKDNPKAARDVVEKLLRRSWRLADLPDIGHEVEGYEGTDLREVLIRPYRLIYLVKKHQIDVVTVLHYRQLLPSDVH